MEALEQVLPVLPPDPRTWKEMRSPEDRSAEGTGTTSAPLAQPGSAPDLELLRAGLPHLWPVRHQVPQECHKPLTISGASAVSRLLPARGRTTGTGVKL